MEKLVLFIIEKLAEGFTTKAGGDLWDFFNKLLKEDCDGRIKVDQNLARTMIQGIHKGFDGNFQQAAEEISKHINKPELISNRSFLSALNKFIIIGPSGSGKTTLYDMLKRRDGSLALMAEASNRTTTHISHKRMRHFGAQFFDTPGYQYKYKDSNLDPEMMSRLAKGKDDVLVLVFTGGRLLSEEEIVDFSSGTPVSRSQNQRKLLKSPEQFFEDVIEEEITWLEKLLDKCDFTPNRGFRALMIVINKMDTWYNKANEVFSYYQGGLSPSLSNFDSKSHESNIRAKYSERIASLISELACRFCVPGVVPTYHPLALRMKGWIDGSGIQIKTDRLMFASMRLLRLAIAWRAIRIGGK